VGWVNAKYIKLKMVEDKEKIYSIYCIQNKINNKIYIGWSSNVKKRWTAERKFAFNIKQRDYNGLLARAFRKYAKNPRDVINHFTFTVIEEFTDLEESLNAEIFWIEYFRTNVKRFGIDAGYNVLDGGGNGILGYKFTTEQKLKLSEIRKGDDNGSAKLNWNIVENIRSEYAIGGVSCEKIGKKYGVNKTTIARIIRNEKWVDANYDHSNIKNIKKINNLNSVSKLSKIQVDEIRKDFNESKLSIKDIAKKYCVSIPNIRFIVNNKTWVENG
jgi:group I intron endonuclease